MSYEDTDDSVASSAPVEGYKFIGSFKTYLYTSADEKILINGENYLPIAIKRANVKAGTQEDDTLSLNLDLPFDIDVVRDYAYAQTPPKLTLELYRQQQDTGEFVLYWTGIVRGFSVTDRTASIQVPSIFSLALKGEIPNVYFQSPCNHVLYDGRCGILRSDNRVQTTVQATSPLEITLDTEPAAAHILAAGEIVNLRTGERRLILDNNGSLIDIGYPFVDMLVGDEVEVVKGCDHSLQTCKDKFDNVINFGGFPYIPADNPFNGSVT